MIVFLCVTKNVHGKGVNALSLISSQKHDKPAHPHTCTVYSDASTLCVMENRCAGSNTASINPSLFSKLETSLCLLVFVSFQFFLFFGMDSCSCHKDKSSAQAEMSNLYFSCWDQPRILWYGCHQILRRNKGEEK